LIPATGARRFGVVKVLIINCGSSSIKYQLYRMPEEKVLAKGAIERIGEPGSRLVQRSDGAKHEVKTDIADHEEAMALILNTLVSKDAGVIKDLSEISACGHRVVHGGEEFASSVLINERVIASIEKFADLAPLHNPPNLIGIRAAISDLPGIPQVACFDTAFHATLPEVAYTYALPHELYEEHGIRRYGFHGSSHFYVARRSAEILGANLCDINAITCHLGNGCSMAAVRGGKSIDTSMGLTPLEGLVMGTRSGDLDPAVLLYLIGKGYDGPTLKDLCNKKSGLLGISGISNDMRNLVQHAEKGNRRAELAIDIFCYRAKKQIGAYAAVLGDLHALVFTGGIGEHAPMVRAGITNGLTQLGIEIDPIKNESLHKGEGDITGPASRVRALVIPTDEEAVIAEDTYELTRIS